MNLQHPLHSRGKYVIWFYESILKLLTLLFHSCFLTLSLAVIQLFVALSQTSISLLPDPGMKGGKSGDTAVKPGWVDAEGGFTLVTGTLFQHSPEVEGTLQKETPGEAGALC